MITYRAPRKPALALHPSRVPYILALFITLILTLSASAPAQPPEGRRRFFPGAEGRGGPAAGAAISTDSLSVTHHTINLNGRPFDYTATAGYLPLKDESGKAEANIFYIAYTSGNGKPDPARPLLFAFNGGPGAAAVWLHVGGLGPKRVVMPADGTALPNKFELADNESTWLDLCDLVFVDPVGTGYSRAAPGVEPRRFYQVQEDMRSLNRFIRLYLTQQERWLSPLYLAGESYGTTRVAAMAQSLQSELGIYPRGVILISSVLDFQTILPGGMNDLPFVLGLPSCTAAAWYHKKLAPPLQADLDKTLAEVRQWAIQTYLPALTRGDALTPGEASRIAEQLAAYTGLPKTLVLNNNLRISTARFARELLRDEGHFLGYMDARVVGVATAKGSETEPYDPAFFLAIGPYVSTFNDYVRRELKFDSTLNYEYLSREAHNAWRYDAGDHYLFVTDNLGQAMAADNRLRVFNAAGLFDLTTPFFGQLTALMHMGLNERLRQNVTFKTYESGHQIYTAQDQVKKLKSDVAAFMGQSTEQK